MIKKIFLLAFVAITMSGCFMGPLTLLGPASSGFSTASVIQSSATTGVNYLVKKSTGKTITEHAFDNLSKDILLQTYLPVSSSTFEIPSNTKDN